MKQKIKSTNSEDDTYINLKEKDLGEEVKFSISKDAFKGPFTCHGKKTVLANKKLSFNGIEHSYSVWRCKACKKEYLDSDEGKKLERLWIFKGLMEDKLITMERNMNYDGKTYFFRFPKELTKDFHKGDPVDIKLLTPDGKMFLVEVK